MNKYLAIVPLALSLAFPASAADKKKNEPGITREQADQILDELRQIRELLEKGARPAEAGAEGTGVRMNLEGGPWLGSKDAPLTLVEFTDYQCAYCQQFHMTTFPELKKKYIDTGKIRFVSRDLPLEFHSNASRAAEAARCAGDQRQFWEMRDRLISNTSRLSANDVDGYAEALKLDPLQFRTCMESGKYAKTVQRDVATAEGFGVTGTPSFLLGKSTRDGVSGVILVGAVPLGEFDAKVKEIAP
ncbi:MAG: DsbA family protein [Bryobacteraceae bacterium]|jgi:protein-disulfide isomerase